MTTSPRLTMTTLIAAFTLMLAGAVHADYASDYKTARDLYYKGKGTQAFEAINKAVASAETQLQKSESLSLASTIALRLKDVEKAMEFAKQIPITEQSLNAQADILSSQKNRQAIIDLYAGTEMSTWPPADASQAYHNLGDAHYHLKQAGEALTAYEKAAEFGATSRYLPNILMGIGNTHRNLLGDKDKALEAYHKVYDSTNNIARHTEAALAIAHIYNDDKAYDKALAELNKIDMLKLSGTYLRVEILRNQAAILTTQGQKEQALALYRKALEHHDIYAFQKKACEDSIKELQGDAQ